MTNDPTIKTHTICVIVKNEAGVLSRVIGLFWGADIILIV